MRFLLLASLLIFGCSRDMTEGPSIPEPTRKSLHMEHGWNHHPWSQGPAAGPTLVLSTEFSLESSGDWGGSELILDGLWWKATVWLNGHLLPQVTGGNAPGVLAIGEALIPGQNVLKLQVDAPTNESVRETGGWLLTKPQAGQNTKSNLPKAELRAAPRIELKPSIHIHRLDLPLTGSAVIPTAQIRGTVEGGRVRFLAAQDGKIIANLGSAPIDSNGIAQTPAQAWDGPLWTPVSPSLIYLVGILEDANGEILDLWTRRVGVRQVRVGTRSLNINGKPTPLMAARAITEPKAGPLGTRLAQWAPGGVNAIEIHGENPPEEWLDMADEQGIPVILLPRCIGRSLNHGNQASQALVDRLIDQDRRMVDSTSSHPSVVLWMTEGASKSSRSNHQHVPMWTDALLEDPQDRPVVDHDLGGRILQVSGNGSSCNTGSCSGAWIAEITGHGQGHLSMSQAYLSAVMNEGAVGGTIPIPQQEDAR